MYLPFGLSRTRRFRGSKGSVWEVLSLPLVLCCAVLCCAVQQSSLNERPAHMRYLYLAPGRGLTIEQTNPWMHSVGVVLCPYQPTQAKQQIRDSVYLVFVIIIVPIRLLMLFCIEATRRPCEAPGQAWPTRPTRPSHCRFCSSPRPGLGGHSLCDGIDITKCPSATLPINASEEMSHAPPSFLPPSSTSKLA